MTVAEQLQNIGESIELFAQRLSPVESTGVNTTYLRTLLERLRQEASELNKLL